jgi:hypothetical protein
MKKIYFTLGLGALILGATAQVKFTKSFSPRFTNNHGLSEKNNAKTAASSTLTPLSFQAGGCALTQGNLTYYSAFGTQAATQFTAVGVGYSFGTNSTTITVPGFGTILNVSSKAAQKYNVTGTGVTVTDVIVLAAKAESMSSSAVVSAQIYSENLTTLAPDVQLGTTATKALNSFNTTGGNVIHFTTPVTVAAGNFFASIESPAIGGANMDTLAIASSAAGCSSLDSLSWTYNTYSAILPSSWSSVNANTGSNLDLAIFAVLDISTGLNMVTKGDLTLSAAFPNPATNQLTVNFALNNSGKTQIDVYDITGKIVNTSKLDNLHEGNQSAKIDVSNLNAGVYIYSIQFNNTKLFSKFTVTK